MKRTQYACDQCRKSKRGCDAPPLELPENTDPIRDGKMIVGEKPPLAQSSPCSYCTKTHKKCTMNWAWTQIQISYALAAAARGEPGIECIVPSRRDSTSTRRESTSTENTRDTPSSNSAVLEDNSTDVQSAAQSFVSQSLPPVPVFSEIEPGLNVPSFFDNSLDALPFDFVPEQPAPLESNFYGVQFKDLTPPEESLGGSWELFKDSTVPPDLQFDAASMSQFPIVSPTEPALSLTAYSPNGTNNEKDWRRTKRRRMSTAWSDTQSSSLSSFTMDQSMMTKSNNQMISTSLLQIYHDVLEHNLSCWLNEVTCPFGRQKNLTQPASLAEWGSSWTNRVLRRTMNLDRTAQSNQLIHLTRQQDSATAKALHLCIMAFATQWAQGSRRHRERYPSLGGIAEENPLNECMDDFKEEFDRHLQRNIWDQARRALDDVADVDSYRVVCAEMIFGLTQKPLDPEDAEHSDVDTFGCFDDVYDMQSVADEIASIIENDGPPVFMERAARRMHTLKYRYDAERKGLTKGRKRASRVSSMSSEDCGTVSLLYWLTVMFDTVSSTMSERPLTVVDANSQHDDARGDTDWNVPLFIQDSLEKPRQNFHWPCSYEEAAEAVTRSAPVKVLMFRHVAYLQNLLRMGDSGEKVEEFIERSARVYRYWNTTYGTFFRELLQNYNSIPGRIQSWFICICAHWNLGVLLLADLISHIDENTLGLPPATQARTNCKWTMRIRERSAKELSDLARVTAPDNSKATFVVPTLSEFHHAINQCMILTEPWTVILIRAFSKAANYWMSEANDLLQVDRAGGEELEERLGRGEECIRILWILGKKSDIARRCAETLSRAKARLPV
ncbi:regulatory alcR [Fusarium beomiforme]|uniref:Regulatory alcR n=1 Tax=Fusarium beomiforme TaxID=44412 RepID=A0A9P5A872_9HYPO|nr:regulatory alcR [Fusarium beomiforme]